MGNLNDKKFKKYIMKERLSYELEDESYDLKLNITFEKGETILLRHMPSDCEYFQLEIKSIDGTKVVNDVKWEVRNSDDFDKYFDKCRPDQ